MKQIFKRTTGFIKQRFPGLVSRLPSGLKQTLGGMQQRHSLATLPQPLQTDQPILGETGVNVLGLLELPIGVAEAARSSCRSLQAVGIPISTQAFDKQQLLYGAAYKPDTTPRYAVNLCHLNAENVLSMVDLFGPEWFAGRYNIAFWFWELEEFPRHWAKLAPLFNEIWVASDFVRDAIAAQVEIPVITVSTAVEPPAMTRNWRSHFELPPDRHVTLLMFEGANEASLLRKNPQAAIEAYRRAAGKNDRCLLLIKTAIAQRQQELHDTLTQATRGLNCRILSADLDRESAWGLIAACDSLISLHRSEGFGLILAEAMALGKPVIATNYSSNTEFMDPSCACMVDYRRVKVGKTTGPYPGDAIWAEPDIDQAAAQLAQLIAEPQLAEELATRARTRVEEQLSFNTVGQSMRRRLATVLPDRQWQ